MSLLLLVLLFVCVLLLATAYLRYRMSQPSRANRVLWNKKDKFTVEQILQKVVGNRISSFIINTASSPSNAWSPMNFGGGSNSTTSVNQQSPFQNTNGMVVVNNNINLSGSRPKNRSFLQTSYFTASPPKYLAMNQHSFIKANSTPKVLVPSKLNLEPTSPNSPSNQPITLSEEEFSNTMIYRKPIERFENKKSPISSISKSPTLNVHSKIANATPKHNTSYRTLNDTLTNLEISPIALKDNTHSLIANTSWVVNNGSILIEDSPEKFSEKVDPNRETQANENNQKEEETTGINDLSMISVGDMSKKSPKGILKVRGTAGTKQHDLSVNVSNLNDSVLNSSALLRKKKVDFGFNNMEGKGIKRDRPKGFDRVVPAPSETSFSRDVQKRTKTNDLIMTETNQQRQDQANMSPPSTSTTPQKTEASFVTEADKSILNDSIINSSYEEKEEKPKRKPKSKGRIGFTTPKTIQKQRVLTCKEDILLRKEIMLQLLRGDQNLVSEKSEETKKTDNNLGSSFNLSSLARKKDENEDKPSSVSAETSSATTTTEAPKAVVTTAQPTTSSTDAVTNPTEPQAVKISNTAATVSEPSEASTITSAPTTSGFQFKPQVPSTQNESSTVSSSATTTTANLNTSQFKIPSSLPSSAGGPIKFDLPKPTLPSTTTTSSNVQPSQPKPTLTTAPSNVSNNTSMTTPSVNPMPSITAPNFMSQPSASSQLAQQPSSSFQLTTNPFSSSHTTMSTTTRSNPPTQSTTMTAPEKPMSSNFNFNAGSTTNVTTSNPFSMSVLNPSTSSATNNVPETRPINTTTTTTTTTIPSNPFSSSSNATISNTSHTTLSSATSTSFTLGGTSSTPSSISQPATSTSSNPVTTLNNNPFSSMRSSTIGSSSVGANNNSLTLNQTTQAPSSSISSTGATPSHTVPVTSGSSMPSSTNVFASNPSKPSLSLQNAPTVPNPFAALKTQAASQSAFSTSFANTNNPFASVNTSKPSTGSVFANARFSFGEESDNTALTSTTVNKPNTFSTGGTFSFLGGSNSNNNPFGSSSGFGTSGFNQRK
ncbi:hypothetical protein C9374_012645 [Naegleria lovaniensis]|uniref:Uncharacterized protein n=1 Tax=Naegleria lovaniensis TaxID=51637 RepID=A0AA88KNQ9_NAELO|nr:uncharacterized protein C9374_012645 [Naegleria lovaniensis]KAG2392393.1 hypothetical protein C9374_012645 [Naegleria lovaniensis]